MRTFLKNFTLFATCSLFAAPSHAHLSIAESAEILPQNEYQIGLEPQLLLNKGGGANFNIFADAPLNESTSARVSFGGGAVDFSAMASLKFVPFPDVDNQPAVGIRGGIGVARDEDQNLTVFQIAPLISKKVGHDMGNLIPYIAVPFQFVHHKSSTTNSSQFAFGTEFTHNDLPELRFGGELGVELSKSYSYISLFVTLPFDSTKGITRK